MRIALEIRIRDPEMTDLLTDHGWNLLVDAPNEIGAEHVEFRAEPASRTTTSASDEEPREPQERRLVPTPGQVRDQSDQ